MHEKISQIVILFKLKKKSKIGETFSYHNEPLKTPVAVKEIINLKDEIHKITAPNIGRHLQIKLPEPNNNEKGLKVNMGKLKNTKKIPHSGDT